MLQDITRQKIASLKPTPWNWILEKLLVSHQVKKFPTYYSAQKTHYWVYCVCQGLALFPVVSQQIQSMYCHHISLQSILSVCVRVCSRRKHLLALSCLYICLYELRSYWMGFCANLYLRVVLKSGKEIRIWLKSDRSIRYCTWSCKYVCSLYMEHPHWCNIYNVYGYYHAHTVHSLCSFIVWQLVSTLSIGHHQAIIQ